MSSYAGFNVWAEPASTTCMKYRRQREPSCPLLPGERFSVARQLERQLPGFKAGPHTRAILQVLQEVSRDLASARQAVAVQRRLRESSSMDRTPPASYYKSVVGTRSVYSPVSSFTT